MPRHVLIVEDDSALRRLYATALRIAGYQTAEATDGVSALRMILADPPSLIVLDLWLPMLNGNAILDEVRDARAKGLKMPRVVVVTGAVEALEHDAADCIFKKPLTPEELVVAVSQCVAKDSVGL